MESKIIYAKSSEEAVEQLLKIENIDKDSIEVIVKENPSKGFLGFGSKDGVYELNYKLIATNEEIISLEKEEVEVEVEVEDTSINEEKIENNEKVNITEEDEIKIAKEFIEGLLVKSDVKAEVEAKIEENLLKINIKGDEASCLIGRRGETLDSIQFLTGLALNKVNKNYHTRVYIDIENYRSKREESLKRYCYKAAREVARTRRTKKLDFMNPYERRIIHSALQNDRYVITYSEGTDPYRRVVIEYKK